MLTAFKQFIKPKVSEQIHDREFDDLGVILRRKVSKIFSRSLAIRVVDTGDDNSTLIEVNNLTNSYYDIERFGISIVASPRHADVLLLVGCMTHNMKIATLKTFDAIPNPKFVIAVGDDAIDGGVLAGSYAILNGVCSILPVDLKIPGDPPTPIEILRGLLGLMVKISRQ